jgi:hypothetical protein
MKKMGTKTRTVAAAMAIIAASLLINFIGPFVRWYNKQMKKNFMSLRSIIAVPNDKTKFCKTCGNTATQEALFNVGGDITVIERYCGICVTNVTSRC